MVNTRKIASSTLVLVLFVVLTPVVLVMTVWGTLALYFCNIPGEWLRMVLATVFAGGTLAAFLRKRNRLKTLLWWLGGFAVLVVYWVWIPASNSRDWTPDVAKEPWAEIDGDRVTIHNIRDFDYHGSDTDYTQRWIDHTYDLRDLETVDFLLCSWGLPDIVHTMFAFRFRNGPNLAMSVETRREKGEEQTAVRGLFKQYEIVYVLGTEPDVFRVRTNFRKPREDIYLYPTNATREQSRALLLDVLKTCNRLQEHPVYYNTICDNCTTGLVPHLRAIGLHRDYCDIRLLKNGLTDQLALEAGWLNTKLPYSELRKHFHVNPNVQGVTDPAQYSRALRKCLDGQ